MRVLLARHGADGLERRRRIQGASDVPLNETGRGAGRALADRLLAMGCAAAAQPYTPARSNAPGHGGDNRRALG